MKHPLDHTQQRPEDIFLAWLIYLPIEADVAMAAASEIGRLDRQGTQSPGIARLRELLQDVIETSRH